MIKAQVITVGASYEAQVSLLTRLGGHGGIEVLDLGDRAMSDVSVALVGPNWAGSSPELAHQVVTLCRLARQGDVPLCVVRERGDWYEKMQRDPAILARNLGYFVSTPLDAKYLVDRIVRAASRQKTSDSPDVVAMCEAALSLREAADRAASAARALEVHQDRDTEAQSDRLAEIRGAEGILRVQAMLFDDQAAHRRIELALGRMHDVEMPASVSERIDSTIREALPKSE